MKKIYLDYNATTPVLPEVLDAMMPFFRDKFGNPASGHFFGLEAASAVKLAAEQIATLIGAAGREIIFTSGGTEANNLAISGFVRGRKEKKKTRVISTQVEHGSVYETCKNLEKDGFGVTYLDVNRDGLIDVEALDQALDNDAALVSLLLVNNETGVIQDFKSIRKVVEKHAVPLHYDAVQALGKMPLDIEQLGASLLSLSAHKIYGPKGAGALYVRSGLTLEPLLFGEGLTKVLRPGTYNVPGIVGFGAACGIARGKLPAYMEHCGKMRDCLEHGIIAAYPAARVNGSREQRICNTTNISFPGFYANKLLKKLDRRGIAVSTAAACSTGKDEASRVLKAMKVPPLELFGALRFSVGEYSCEADLDYVMEQLVEILREQSETPGDSEIINLQEYFSL